MLNPLFILTGSEMKKIFILSLLIIIAVSQAEYSQSKKYDLNSGKITYSSKVMGKDVTTILYFEQNGNVECRETMFDMTVMKRKISSKKRTLIKDGYLYDLDLVKKTGTKRKITAGQSLEGEINFRELTEKEIKKYDVKELGNENVLNKSCKKYSINSKILSGTFWVWNNISLRAEFGSGIMATSQTATKIEENIKIPVEIFEVPKDIVITNL